MITGKVTPRENFLLAVKHREPYWLPCPMFDGSIFTIEHDLVERRENGRDDWGVLWELKDSRSDSFPIEHPLRDPSEVEDYPLPSPEESQIIERAKKAVSKVDRNRVIVAGVNGWGLFERAWLLIGMLRFFMWSFRHPDALKKLIERIAEVKVRLSERLIEEVGVDLIMYGDDWGMEDRPLLSPEQWRTFIKPWQSKLYDVVKQRGVLIYQHSDGKVEDLIPDLTEIRVDILNIQPECNDWHRILNKYGKRIVLWGGVSARTLDIGAPEEVVKEVEECAQLGRFGGIILAPGHSLKYPKEKIEIMKKAWLIKGKYKST